MASEPSSVFKRFDYTEDWEEQIHAYLELVRCGVDEATVQEYVLSENSLEHTQHTGSDFHRFPQISTKKDRQN